MASPSCTSIEFTSSVTAVIRTFPHSVATKSLYSMAEGPYDHLPDSPQQSTRTAQRSNVRLCGEFWTPATTWLRSLNWPASKKRQGTKSREVWRRRTSECYEVLDLGKFEEWRPRMRAQLKRFGTIVAKWGI